MRVTPGPGSGDFRREPRQPRLDILARWFTEAVPVAESHAITLAAENHGDYTADEMLWLVEAVGSPSFRGRFLLRAGQQRGRRAKKRQRRDSVLCGEGGA